MVALEFLDRAACFRIINACCLDLSVPKIGESALYPALQRLLFNGWVKAQWGTSENNRRARYYTLTPRGRKQLGAERAEFDRMVGAIQRVLGTA